MRRSRSSDFTRLDQVAQSPSGLRPAVPFAERHRDDAHGQELIRPVATGEGVSTFSVRNGKRLRPEVEGTAIGPGEAAQVGGLADEGRLHGLAQQLLALGQLRGSGRRPHGDGRGRGLRRRVGRRRLGGLGRRQGVAPSRAGRSRSVRGPRRRPPPRRQNPQSAPARASSAIVRAARGPRDVVAPLIPGFIRMFLSSVPTLRVSGAATASASRTASPAGAVFTGRRRGHHLQERLPVHQVARWCGQYALPPTNR